MNSDRIFLIAGAASLVAVTSFLVMSRMDDASRAAGTTAGLTASAAALPATPAAPVREAPAARSQTRTADAAPAPSTGRSNGAANGSPGAPSNAAPSGPSPDKLYAACASGNWPTAENAQARIAACSQALLTHQLSPTQVAVARLMRAQGRAASANRTLSANDFAEAVRRPDAAANPDNAAALDAYRRAVAHYGEGNLNGAIDDYGEAIRIDPENALAHLGRGVMLASRERSYERAIEDFDRVLAIGHDKLKALVPGDDLYLFALVSRGEAYGQLGQLGRSLADLNRAIAAAPGYVKAYVARAQLRVRRGETTLAMQDYEKALSIEPRNAVALSDRAALYASEGHFAMAIADLDTALDAYPDNASFLYNRGYAHFWRGNYDKALADYSAALAVAPTMVQARINRCLARLTVGRDLSAALADCNAAIDLDPGNPAAVETRGLAYLKLGKPDLAAADFAVVLDSDPNRPIALYGRALCRAIDPLTATLVQAAGEDREAAMALDPGVGTSFARLGLH